MRKYILALACVLFSGCATQKLEKAHAAKVVNIHNVEIFYNDDSYAVIVQPAGGIFALASIGEEERIMKRSAAFSDAVKTESQEQDINLQFATAVSKKIEASGRRVKITKIRPATGATNIFSTDVYKSLPRTEGYAPLVLRIYTRYIAPSFMQGFVPKAEVSYALAGADGRPMLESWLVCSIGDTYATADALLRNVVPAQQRLRDNLMSLVDPLYRKTFPAQPNDSLSH